MDIEQKTSIPHNFTLDSFSKAHQKMIATNTPIKDRSRYFWDRQQFRDYTNEEVASIINSGSSAEQQKLSRNYFNTEGYYSQIILHYATLLTYSGLLIPNPSIGKNLSNTKIQKRYYNAMDYVEKMDLQSFLTKCAINALIDGCYYGIIADAGKDSFAVIDLPAGYCRSRFKDGNGNDIIELNLAYFNTFGEGEEQKNALAAFPRVITKAYREWSKGRNSLSWFIVPSDIAICFPLLEGRPPFLSVIPATIKYDEAVELDVARNQDEIHKILVQKVPHLNDGRLVFEPDEALEMHQGAVGMLKGNSNISVLTTYADVDAIASKGSTENSDSSLTKMEKNIYAQAGTSSEIFTSSGSSSLNASIKNDIAFMMILANKFSKWITNLLNSKFSNGNVAFKYIILPISYHTQDNFVETSFKLVGSGYSFLMPVLGFGLSQRDFGNLKDLENTLLKLNEKMIPPSTSYTQTSSGKDGDGTSEGGAHNEKEVPNTDINEGGRPSKEDSQKADTTLKKEESLEKNGGGS